VKGRKRHIFVDTLGIPLAVVITPANVSDSAGLIKLIEPCYKQHTRIKKLFLDQGYKEGCINWLQNTTGWEVEKIAIKDDGERGLWTEQKTTHEVVKPGFVLKPKRWVVERTFGWLGRYRRLSKDYEAKCDTEEAWIWIATSRFLLYRLDSS
jgi:putative transposase